MDSSTSRPLDPLTKESIDFFHYELWVNLFQLRRAQIDRRQVEHDESKVRARIAGLRARLARDSKLSRTS